MKNFKKLLNALLDGILFIMGLDCEARREAVDAGLLDFSGQGRDKYGK